MSRQTMAAAADGVSRQTLFGIASCRVGVEFCDFEIGWDEIDRDTRWATDILREAGLRKGDLVLVTLPNWEGPWFSPVMSSLRQLGVTYTLAENYAWDARRVAHLIASLKPRAFVGLCADTLEGLSGMGIDAAELIGGMDYVWARHDALPKLAELNLSAIPLVPLGPALAIGVPGTGTVVNTAEWTLSTLDGEFVVSTAAPRVARFDNLATGVRGAVGGQGRLGTTVDIHL